MMWVIASNQIRNDENEATDVESLVTMYQYLVWFSEELVLL